MYVHIYLCICIHHGDMYIKNGAYDGVHCKLLPILWNLIPNFYAPFEGLKFTSWEKKQKKIHQQEIPSFLLGLTTPLLKMLIFATKVVRGSRGLADEEG